MIDTDVERISALKEAISLIRSCGAYSWATDRDRADADKWHTKAVEFLKRIGAW